MERQSSDFALETRQESILEPGYVRPPKSMAPPTPVEWGRGDSLMWDQSGKQPDTSTPLAGYGREKDLFSDAVATLSPNTDSTANAFPPQAPQEATAGGGQGARAATTGKPVSTSSALAPKPKQDAFPGLAYLAAERQQMEERQQMVREGRLPPSSVGGGGKQRGGGPTVQPPQHQHQQQQQQHEIVGAPPAGASAGGTAPGWGAFGGGGGGAGGTMLAPQLQQPPSSGGVGERPITRQTTSEAQLAAQFRTPSQIMTDELHFQAKSFPPPPPVVAPGQEQRRNRAARWYYFAAKWDITHVQPPPPRSPLPQMDFEKQNPNLRSDGPMYPYRGEYWLERCHHWFRHVQGSFQYPVYTNREVAGQATDTSVVLRHCFTD